MDIQDAYLPMARSVQKYLRFMVNGRVYHFTCLPFGLATSPREFTKLLWPVVQLLRLQGIKLHVYLNDWLIPSSSVVQARTHADLVLQVLQHLGWVINFSKSNLVPSQQFYSYWHAVQHMRLHRGTSTQNAGQNPEHPGSMEITPAHIYQGSVQTLGMLSCWHSRPLLCQEVEYAFAQSSGGRQRYCARRRGPGQTGFQWPRPFSIWWLGAAGGFTECPRDRDNFIHRCLQSRMGGAAGLPYAARDVVSAAGKPAYQSVRDGGSVSECNSVPASTQVSGSAPDVRQRRGCFLHQQERQDQIVQTDPPDDWALEILRPEGHQASACSSSRISQHPGRRSVASGPDSCEGMDHQWPASSSGVLHMGNTSDPSVRNFCQQEAAYLPITISGPKDQIRRCDVSTVVRDGNGVRLPTIQDAAGCPLNKLCRSHNLLVILISPHLMSASWMLELSEQPRCPPIPLDGHPLLTQEVRLPRGHVETRHYRPSNLHAWLLWRVFLPSSVTAGA